MYTWDRHFWRNPIAHAHNRGVEVRSPDARCSVSEVTLTAVIIIIYRHVSTFIAMLQRHGLVQGLKT